MILFTTPSPGCCRPTSENTIANLNQDKVSRDPEPGGTLVWTPTHLLREAVLNNNQLPLESFATARTAGVVVRRIKTPKPPEA